MKTILLIDDDELCRTSAAAMLRLDQWLVLEAADGEVGLALAIAHRPDIIFCDLLIPGLNGFHLCRAVRERLQLRHSKLIVCTARDFPGDRESAAEAGADIYLIKPLNYELVRKELARLVGIEVPVVNDLNGFHRQNAQSTRVKFWGVRGSIPTPGPSTVHYGGNTACVEVRDRGELIILDAGSGMRALGDALAQEFGREPIHATVLITHTHWDHIQGFPFFLPAYDAKNHLHILGYEGARDGLRDTLAGQMESPYFPIALHQMPGNIVIEELKEMHFAVGGVPVRSCFANHPGVCVGYRIQTSAGSIVYMPDNETFSKEAVANHGEQIPETMEANLREFLAGADIFIADTQYSADEYEHHVGWGHGCIDAVVRLAVEAKVKRLFLFHHDPAHDDAFMTKMVARAREIVAETGSPILVEAAREGQEIVLAE